MSHRYRPSSKCLEREQEGEKKQKKGVWVTNLYNNNNMALRTRHLSSGLHVCYIGFIKEIRKGDFCFFLFTAMPIKRSRFVDDVSRQLYAFRQCSRQRPAQHRRAGPECVGVSTLVNLVHSCCIFTAKPNPRPSISGSRAPNPEYICLVIR